MVIHGDTSNLIDAVREDVWPRLLDAAPGLAPGEALRALLWSIAARLALAKGIAGPASEGALRLIGKAAERPVNRHALEAAVHVTGEVDWSGAEVHALGDLYAVLREDRRANGRYFTPSRLAARVAEWTLPERSQTRMVQIADLAMGSGHFLIAAADYIAGEGADSRTRWEALQGLHGADRDPVAVELARLVLR